MSALIAIRAIALSIVVFLVDYFLPLGTSPFALAASCTLGVILGGLCARSRLKLFGFCAILLLIALSLSLLSKLGEYISLSLFTDPLYLHSIQLHASLAFITFIIGTVSTWTVIRSIHGLSAEVLIIIFSSLYFFSGHRNFNFQSPQILGTLAWSLGYSPLAVLTAIGVTLIIVTLLYLRICSGLHEERLKIKKHLGKNLSLSRARSALSTICVLTLFIIIGNSIFARYKVEAEARTSNGVGQGKEENQSPLGFNSALGASNQPAALVRLDGDYRENPFVPMLYLRESALSQYNGTEMVAADARFDKDTAATPPSAHYKAEDAPDWQYRTPLIQSIYLLADHKLSFAVDFPVSINPIKNPNPGRFRAALKAYSMAPSFSKESLNSLEVGDPNWDQQTKEHYLKINPDHRYSELAKKVTENFSTPIEKALALTNYLSEKAIYTLSPGHEIPQNGDQTAPFLFGDMRGYCVHFAHALVYLFRSLNIPARVGTGYLTDLSEARDGHILLRMSDRHAWAEIFIKDRGWVPFDPKPQQVESHAESPVDMKLLEELMGLVGPDEEILPADLAKDEVGLNEISSWQLPQRGILIAPILIILISFILIKMHLWFSWIWPWPAHIKLKRLYRALAARLNDLGIGRVDGETREEYRKRASKLLGLDLLSITKPLNMAIYSNKIEANNLVAIYRADISNLSKISISRKAKAALNPASIIRFLSRAGW